jgi:anti-sigma B factor antagonist
VDTHRGPGGSDPRFDIRSQAEDDVCLIEVRGEVDEGTAPELSAALEAAVGAGARAVVVDLCRVTFMDSRGLWVLIRARRALSRHSIGLSLACPADGAPGRLLALTGLATAFDIHASSAEALDAVLGPGRTRLEDPSRPTPRRLDDIERRLEAMLDDLASRDPVAPPDVESTG